MQKRAAPTPILIIIMILATILILGIGTGLLYASLPEHHPERDKQSCENAGGEWTDDQTCLLSHKNAGEPCTDGGECVSGICSPPPLTDAQKLSLTDGPVTGITGTCYPEGFVTGCVPQVLKGTITERSMCLNE